MSGQAQAVFSPAAVQPVERPTHARKLTAGTARHLAYFKYYSGTGGGDGAETVADHAVDRSSRAVPTMVIVLLFSAFRFAVG